MHKALFLIGSLLFLLTAAAKGEEVDTLLLRPNKLDEVDIVGHVISHKVTATMPTQEVSDVEMKSMGAQNVADIVRHFAGTNVKDYGGLGGLKTVSVRGLAAGHTAILYDGLIVSNCQAGQVDIGCFPINHLKTVSLSIGQEEELGASARALASGSILRLETSSIPVIKDGDVTDSLTQDNNDRGYRRVHFEGGLKAGSFYTINPFAFASYTFNDHLQVNAFADVVSMKGSYPYLLTNGGITSHETRTNSDLKAITTECNLHYALNHYQALNAKAYYHGSKRGLPGAVILYNPVSHERLDDRNLFLQTQYRYWKGAWQVYGRAKYNHGEDCYTDTNVKYQNGMQKDINQQDEYYLQGTVAWRPHSSFGLAIAQDGIVNSLWNNLPSCPFPTRLTSFTSLQANYEGTSLKIHGSLLSTFITEQVKAGIRPDDRHKITPMTSISIRPFESQTFFLRMMYKETYRMPAFNELYYFRVGNKNLRPEWARELNAGLTWDTSIGDSPNTLSITVDGYHNFVRDKIVSFPTTYVWKMANYGRVSIDGFDATVSTALSPAKEWTAEINIACSYQKALDITSNDSKTFGMQLPYTPIWSGSGNILLTMPWCQLGYSIIAASKRHSIMDSSAIYQLHGYMEHSATISRSIDLKSSSILVQAEAINFTGAQYEIIQYYPMPLRQYRASATWKF